MDVWVLKDELSYRRYVGFVSRLSSFLNSVCWLADAFVLEFFTENHWDRLPPSWRHFLDGVDLTYLATWLSEGKCRSTQVCPLSLLAFRTAAQSLYLPRRPQRAQNRLQDLLFNNYDCQGAADQPCRDSKVDSCRLLNERQKQMGSFSWNTNLRRRVKLKKQHEIGQLAQVISGAMNSLDIHLMVDIGSGQGHLSRLMAISYNHKVISIDAEISHITGAKSLDSKIEQKMSRMTTQNLNLPTHLTHKLTSDTCAQDFLKLLGFDSSSNHQDFPSFSVVGLHSCGNFAGTLLNIFVECAKAEILLIVPCCYMKEDVGSGKQKSSRYPLSKAVSATALKILSYEAKELACHATERYQKKLLEEGPTTLKIHCYRAVLEFIITKRYPEKKRLGLRGVKRAQDMSFAEYAILATSKLNLDLPETDLTSAVVQKFLQQWKRVIAFYSLRMMLAPAIETMLLTDRLIYLYEKDCRACIVPVFNPDISPRNHAIIAVKKPLIKCK